MTIEMGGMARAEPPARHTPPPRNQRDGAEAARASPRNHGDRAPPGAEVTSGHGGPLAALGRAGGGRGGRGSAAAAAAAGLCVKTRAGGDKVFVNVCHSPEVPPPPPVSPPGLQRLLREPPGPDGGFRIPMSLGEPHAELDRGGRGCTAYDVVVNSGFFRTLQADPLYLEFFLTVAMEGLSEKYGVELELTGWRVLRNRKFLGSISAQNIRARPRPHIQELPGPPDPPQFVVVAEPSAQEPQVLQARVHLPQVEGAGSLWLGLSEERLLLLRPPPPGGAAAESGAGPPARQGALLELGLPLPADPARCRARFHRRSKVLTVTMPLRA
ncbi:PIH1 domain-containing protein 1 isoform X4 [Vidua chalybeata]|uniref:PIH1 domain-containing protein 1 isoform X4 n=1 Tax=Vidua chalybeata TaxID=81927 RepID=UPI0023A7C003|nr:PIH1 domain-containing protein 1 isoform X4 [Vidua chalybeata]